MLWWRLIFFIHRYCHQQCWVSTFVAVFSGNLFHFPEKALSCFLSSMWPTAMKQQSKNSCLVLSGNTVLSPGCHGRLNLRLSLVGLLCHYLPLPLRRNQPTQMKIQYLCMLLDRPTPIRPVIPWGLQRRDRVGPVMNWIKCVNPFSITLRAKVCFWLVPISGKWNKCVKPSSIMLRIEACFWLVPISG